MSQSSLDQPSCDQPLLDQPSFDQSLPKVSILILAGGRATRMHGIDKGLVRLHGKTLVERIYHQVYALSDDILISANRHQHAYQRLLPDCHIIADEWSDFRGPLAGIYSGLTHKKHAYLWVIPCDLMLLPDHCLPDLWQALQSAQCQIAYASLNDRALYPLCLLRDDVHDGLKDNLENNLTSSLRHELDQQHYAVRHWFAKHQSVMVNFKIENDLPLNLNTLHDVGLVEDCYTISSQTPTTTSRDQE